MSEGPAYLLAIALIIAVFMILMYVFQERNFLLKYLFIMGILVAAFFIPTAVYDVRQTCQTVVSNSTSVSSTITSYEYEQVCFTTTSTTPDTFYTVFWSIYLMLIIYFILKILHELYLYLKQTANSLKFWKVSK